MVYKRKGIDFCAYPGCLNQEYGGECGELVYCPEHIDQASPEFDLAYCKNVARRQEVDFFELPPLEGENA